MRLRASGARGDARIRKLPQGEGDTHEGHHKAEDYWVIALIFMSIYIRLSA
jgi:hypothetical protein